MIDSRVHELARRALVQSCGLERGERVLIETVDVPVAVIVAFVHEARVLGLIPFVRMKSEAVIRELALSQDVDGIRVAAECELQQMREVDALVMIRCIRNACELADVPQAQRRAVADHYLRPVHLEYRNQHMRFVALRWPSPTMAERAGMSSDAFQDFFFDACLLDYKALSKRAGPLLERMGETDQVRIVGPEDTYLTFSIKAMPVSPDMGERNLPDGEVSTAPIRDSINGRIRYNLPLFFHGTEFRDVVFDFRDGRVVNMTCGNVAALRRLLDQDEGARYIGEFALGLNPNVTSAVGDVLFDEKMIGSLHLAQGNAYGRWDNGNRSAVHLDFVLSQRPEHGGGELWFDGELVRKDGVFTSEDLADLNSDSEDG